MPCHAKFPAPWKTSRRAPEPETRDEAKLTFEHRTPPLNHLVSAIARLPFPISRLPILTSICAHALLPPFPRHHPLRRARLHLPFAHLRPVRAQRGAVALLVALHHRALRVRVRVLEDLLEERVRRIRAVVVVVDVGILFVSLISAVVCVFVGFGGRFLREVRGELVPVLGAGARGGGVCRRGVLGRFGVEDGGRDRGGGVGGCGEAVRVFEGVPFLARGGFLEDELDFCGHDFVGRARRIDRCEERLEREVVVGAGGQWEGDAERGGLDVDGGAVLWDAFGEKVDGHVVGGLVPLVADLAGWRRQRFGIGCRGGCLWSRSLLADGTGGLCFLSIGAGLFGVSVRDFFHRGLILAVSILQAGELALRLSFPDQEALLLR